MCVCVWMVFSSLSSGCVCVCFLGCRDTFALVSWNEFLGDGGWYLLCRAMKVWVWACRFGRLSMLSCTVFFSLVLLLLFLLEPDDFFPYTYNNGSFTFTRSIVCHTFFLGLKFIVQNRQLILSMVTYSHMALKVEEIERETEGIRTD